MYMYTVHIFISITKNCTKYTIVYQFIVSLSKIMKMYIINNTTTLKLITIFINVVSNKDKTTLRMIKLRLRLIIFIS